MGLREGMVSALGEKGVQCIAGYHKSIEDIMICARDIISPLEMFHNNTDIPLNILNTLQCKNIGVLKNYIGSFFSNVDNNIENTLNKAGMIFSSNLDRLKVNPLMFCQVLETGLLAVSFVWC